WASGSRLARTGRHGRSVASWKTYPMRSAPTWTWPAVASSRPLAMRSRVLLPQPDGPTTEVNSPAATAKSAPVNATVPSLNVLSTLLNCSAVFVASVTGLGSLRASSPSWSVGCGRSVQRAGHRRRGDQAGGTPDEAVLVGG